MRKNHIYCLVLLSLFFVFFIGCSKSGVTDESKEKDTESSPQNEPFKFKTKDQSIEFIVFNKGKFQKEILEEIKEESLHLYEEIRKDNLPINSPEKIYINVLKEDKISFANENTLQLYWTDSANSPLIHELSHILFGHNSNKGNSLIQEGIAIYMQDNYSNKKVFPNYQANIHIIMNFLKSEDLYIPLEILMNSDKNFDYTNLNKDSYALRWLSYIEAGSFSRFLIEKYGIDSFQLFVKGGNREIVSIYGKDLVNLENEWNVYIKNERKIDKDELKKYNPQLPGIINHLMNKNEIITN